MCKFQAYMQRATRAPLRLLKHTHNESVMLSLVSDASDEQVHSPHCKNILIISVRVCLFLAGSVTLWLYSQLPVRPGTGCTL